MKIHLIKKQTIEDCVKGNVQSKLSFEDWLEKIKTAEWLIPGDITTTYLPICWVKEQAGLFLILPEIITG